MSLFITGTDTHVGKTFVSACLSKLFEVEGVGYFKPIQTGTDSDSKTVRHLSGLDPARIARPVYDFPEPLSPNRAAALNGKSIEIPSLIRYFKNLPLKNYIVEGAGGVMVPLTPTETMLDFMQALSLPVLVVARTQLGTLNHTLLTLSALKARKLNCLGTVCVGESDEGLSQIIQEHSKSPVLAEIPHFHEISPQLIKTLSASPLGMSLKEKLKHYL